MREEFFPDFYLEPAPIGTFRALVKTPSTPPSKQYYAFLKKALCLSDDEFTGEPLGLKQIPVIQPKTDVKELFSGLEVSLDAFDRAKASVIDGKRTDILRGNLPPIADGVIYVGNDDDLAKVFSIAKGNGLSVSDKGDRVFLLAEERIIAVVDFSKYAYVVEFNQINHLLTISKGVTIESAEKYLNNVKEIAKRSYTLDLPELRGDVERNAVDKGYKEFDGVRIQSASTLRFYEPRGKKRFAYVFKNFDLAITCLRELKQSGNDLELLLLDENASVETFSATTIEPIEKYFSIRGYKRGKRAVILGIAKGGRKILQFNCPEFTSLCPITGQPDLAEIKIHYIPGERMVESKSLKLYLFSFRNHGDFHEDCVNIIMKDLVRLMEPKYIEVVGLFTPRGGISIYPYANYGQPGTKYADLAERRLMEYQMR